MATPVIELRGMARTYPGAPPVPALRPADLVIEERDYVAVTGPSGSGKSTLLHLLGLLDSPTQGSYLLDGLDTSALGDRDRSALRGSRIGFVFQSFHLLPYRTALENVLLAQLYNQTPRGGRVRAAVGALDAVRLGHRLDALPTTLSGGECQRVAMARALVNRPSLLLCDEPTGNLDSRTADALMELLDQLNAAGFTIVVITHDAGVAAHASRTIAISDGVLSERDRGPPMRNSRTGLPLPRLAARRRGRAVRLPGSSRLRAERARHRRTRDRAPTRPLSPRREQAAIGKCGTIVGDFSNAVQERGTGRHRHAEQRHLQRRGEGRGGQQRHAGLDRVHGQERLQLPPAGHRVPPGTADHVRQQEGRDQSFRSVSSAANQAQLATAVTDALHPVHGPGRDLLRRPGQL